MNKKKKKNRSRTTEGNNKVRKKLYRLKSKQISVTILKAIIIMNVT